MSRIQYAMQICPRTLVGVDDTYAKYKIIQIKIQQWEKLWTNSPHLHPSCYKGFILYHQQQLLVC